MSSLNYTALLHDSLDLITNNLGHKLIDPPAKKVSIEKFWSKEIEGSIFVRESR